MDIYQNLENIASVLHCVNGNIEISILQGFNETEKIFTGSFAEEKLTAFLQENNYLYISTK